MARFLDITIGITLAAATVAIATYAFGEDVPPLHINRFLCPTREPCRVLILNDQEVQILTGERGILATAAAARTLDLAAAAAYFSNKITGAQRGEPPPEPVDRETG